MLVRWCFLKIFSRFPTLLSFWGLLWVLLWLFFWRGYVQTFPKSIAFWLLFDQLRDIRRPCAVSLFSHIPMFATWAFWFHIYLFLLLHSPYFTCWTPISCSFQSQVSLLSASNPYFWGFFLFMNLPICFSLEFHIWLVVSPIESSHSLPKAALLRTGWAMATFGAPFRRSYGPMLTGRWRMQRETSHGGSISWQKMGNQAEMIEMMVQRCFPVY